jgi:tetratricopeptide (TPR) repeat protein
MNIRRLTQRSVVVATSLAISAVAVAQDAPSLQKLYESGQHGAIIERAAEGRGGSPEDIYLAALAYLKSDNPGAAAGEMRRLQEQGDAAWQQVGASGVAMVEHNGGEAVAAGRRATEQGGDNPYAHYQLGLAAAAANDFETAANAFARATELKPDFAYAHYYAGQSFQKQRALGRAADHYQYFLNLAPDSPDRAPVQAILRTLRK